MSKIICEICGTAYSETSTQCPICGYVRSAETAGIMVDEASENATGQYTYVKGGRFSKANVKKRNRDQQKAAGTGAAAVVNNERTHSEKKKKGKKNIGFILFSIILLLLVLALVVFLTIKYFGRELPEVTIPQDSTPQQTESISDTILCNGVTLDVTEVVLHETGEARMIYAVPTPANTTESLEFQSSDETVATVTENGKIVAVGPGEATITVTCGGFQDTCLVKCEFEKATEPTTEQTEPTTAPTEETTAPTEAPTTEPAIALEQSMFNRKDFSLLFKGEKWTLYTGEIDPSLITWSSDNPNVATIENGVVKAIGRGTTTVYAEYNGVKISCIVRCNF